MLRLLGMGYTNAQIASQLVVSVRTVDSHVRNLRRKFADAGCPPRGPGRLPFP